MEFYDCPVGDTYEVVLSDAFDCEQVISNPFDCTNCPATFDLSFVENCDETTGTLTLDITINSGTPPFIHEVTGGQYEITAATNFVSCPIANDDLYEVIVTDGNGCTISLTGAAPCVIDCNTEFQVTHTPNDCYVDEFTLDVEIVSGTPPYTYSIAGGSSQTTLSNFFTTPPLPETYTVTIVDANGCEEMISGTHSCCTFYANIIYSIDNIIDGEPNVILTCPIVGSFLGYNVSGGYGFLGNGPPYTNTNVTLGLTQTVFETDFVIESGTIFDGTTQEFIIEDNAGCQISFFVICEENCTTLNYEENNAINCTDNLWNISLTVTNGTPPYTVSTELSNILPTPLEIESVLLDFSIDMSFYPDVEAVEFIITDAFGCQGTYTVCDDACTPACPTCSDGTQNQGETGIDCGGPCLPCPVCHVGVDYAISNATLDCTGQVLNNGEILIVPEPADCPVTVISNGIVGNPVTGLLPGNCHSIEIIPDNGAAYTLTFLEVGLDIYTNEDLEATTLVTVSNYNSPNCNGTIEVSVNGGTGSYSYEYPDCADCSDCLDCGDVDVQTEACAGTYTLIITDLMTGCQTTETFTVGFQLSPFNPIKLQVIAILEGAFDFSTGKMGNSLQNDNILPLAQPYNRIPWNYAGLESVGNTSEFPTGTTDWVLIEARDSSNMDSVMAQKAGLLLDTGELLAADGSNFEFDNLLPGNYYIVIRHRNHLAVITSTAIPLPTSTPYYFTTGQDKAMGNNQLVEVATGIFALHAGDYDSNGVVTISDYDPNASGSVNDYKDQDGNLDKNVTTTDYNLYQSNATVIGVQEVRY